MVHVPPPQPYDVGEQNIDSDIVRFMSPVAAHPDLSSWEQATSAPETAFADNGSLWYCALMEIPPVEIGGWRFVGVSKHPLYTPIDDVHSEITGKANPNNRAYYHFIYVED